MNPDDSGNTDITDDPEQRVPSELLHELPSKELESPYQSLSGDELYDREKRDMRKAYSPGPMELGVSRNLTPEELRARQELCGGGHLKITPESIASILRSWERFERPRGLQSRSEVLSESRLPSEKRKDSSRDFSDDPMIGESQENHPQGEP